MDFDLFPKIIWTQLCALDLFCHKNFADNFFLQFFQTHFKNFKFYFYFLDYKTFQQTNLIQRAFLSKHLMKIPFKRIYFILLQCFPLNANGLTIFSPQFIYFPFLQILFTNFK